jgi:hypothetical protein
MDVFLKTCIVYNVLTHREQFHQSRLVDLSMAIGRTSMARC